MPPVVSSGEPDAVASHLTAARVHGLAMPFGPFGANPEHVTVTRSARRRQRRELRFHGRPLALGDVVPQDRVPVTSVPRTLVDLAGLPERLFAVWAIDDAVRVTCVTWMLSGWRRNSGLVVVRGRCANGWPRRTARPSRSCLETVGRLCLLDADLPLPQPRYELRDGDGSLIARLDGAYVRQQIGIEYDGRGPHSKPSTVYRDRWRQNGVSAQGWTILRFTWWDVVHDPARFVESVRSALLQPTAARVGGT